MNVLEDQVLLASSSDRTITSHSRSSSRDSGATTSASLHRASTTVDDLTRAIASFSQATTPNSVTTIVCCCGRGTCTATEAWLAAKSKLEKSLELSAEVGSALLERHEAYVRRQDTLSAENERNQARAESKINSLQLANEQLVSKMAETIRENNILEKRLAQAQLNLELADSSNRTLIKELQETRSTVSRLSSQNARSAGWDIKVASLTQERDDLRQENESERHRSRVAELRAVAAADKCTELQTEVARLRSELDVAKLSRSDVSEMLLQDARARLEMLTNSIGTSNVLAEDAEVTKMLENLVADNESLKRDNAELQNLLGELREDLRTSREELEEHQATSSSAPPTPATPGPNFFSNASTIPSTVDTSTLNARRSIQHSRKTSWAPSLSSSRGGGPRIFGHRTSDSYTGSIASSGVGPFQTLAQSPGASPTIAFNPLRASSPRGYTGHSAFPSTSSVGGRRSSAAAAPLSTTGGASVRRSLSIDASSLKNRHTSAADRSFGEESGIGSPLSENQPMSAADLESDGSPWMPAIQGSPEKPRTKRRTLMLLSRSRGVQTDGTGSQSTDATSADPFMCTCGAGNALSRSRSMKDMKQAAALSSHPPNLLLRESTASSTSATQSPRPTSSLSDLISTQETGSDTSSVRMYREGMSSMGASSSTNRAFLELPTHSFKSSVSSSNFTGSESNKSNPLPSLIDAVTGIHTRLGQADIRSLSNRLKRQNLLVGGDIGHLSRSTLNTIIVEVNNLRGQFKVAGIEDNDIASVVSRKDVRMLLKVFKELLIELAQLRGLLNKVTLDPTQAARLKELALSDEAPPPTPTEVEIGERGRSGKTGRKSVPGTGTGLIPGWMVPAQISKLFGGQTQPASSSPLASGSSSVPRSGAENRAETDEVARGRRLKLRAAPKLAPAVSASTTTVNVEFGSTGTRGATVDDGPSVAYGSVMEGGAFPDESFAPSLATTAVSIPGSVAPSISHSDRSLGRSFKGRNEGLLGIFAGAPEPSTAKKDGWVVLPNKDRVERKQLKTRASSGDLTTRGGLAGRRATQGYNPHRLSRIVDAVTELGTALPEEDEGFNGMDGGLLERTLRPRGLSDSSMHSTFRAHAGVGGGSGLRGKNPVHRLMTPSGVALNATTSPLGDTTVGTSFVDTRESVFQSLSRTVQSYMSIGTGEGGSTESGSGVPSETAFSPQSSDVQLPSAGGHHRSDTVTTFSSPPKPIPGTGVKKRIPNEGGRSASPARMLNFFPGIAGSVSNWVIPPVPEGSGTGSVPGSFREEGGITRHQRGRGGGSRDFI